MVQPPRTPKRNTEKLISTSGYLFSNWSNMRHFMRTSYLFHYIPSINFSKKTNNGTFWTTLIISKNSPLKFRKTVNRFIFTRPIEVDCVIFFSFSPRKLLSYVAHLHFNISEWLSTTVMFNKLSHRRRVWHWNTEH